jgi:hypothetical protein
MNDDERKSRLHINFGGLIILVIIILILFKVDIKAKIKSPQFQKNITYIEDTVKGLYTKYLVEPFKTKAVDLFKSTTDKELKRIQTNFADNVLKIPTNADIEKNSSPN